ncbi:MAG: hypothetical protein ACJZ7Z_10290 [Myxococcota bacterium]|nr:hypothetical protein [Spirochaeta sp.]RPG09371.1 MAG: hypothetical protein CBC32_007395 [Proteobacteria bacterium TMED72]
MALEESLAELGRELVEREREHSDERGHAFDCAKKWHSRLASGLETFHAQVLPNAPHLEVVLSEPRVDDKHMHSVQFDLGRGRHRAIVTVKSRGEMTLVGPFKAGKQEGPCRSFPTNAEGEIEGALEEFVQAFIREAATP